MAIEPNLATLVALLLASVIMWIKTDSEARSLRKGQNEIHSLTNSNLQVVRGELADARRTLLASLKEVDRLKEEVKALTAKLEELIPPRAKP